VSDTFYAVVPIRKSDWPLGIAHIVAWLAGQNVVYDLKPSIKRLVSGVTHLSPLHFMIQSQFTRQIDCRIIPGNLGKHTFCFLERQSTHAALTRIVRSVRCRGIGRGGVL
jgi:hypothetical protein